MSRARLVVWGGVIVIGISTLWLASARSASMRETEIALGRAERLLDRGDAGAAAAALTRLVRQQPRCAGAHALLADARSMQGRDAQALEHYRAAVDLAPRDAQACYDLVACCVAAHSYDVAERYLVRRLRDEPADLYARRLLALVRDRRDRG